MSYQDEIENLKNEFRDLKQYLGIQQIKPAYGPAKGPFPLANLESAILKLLPILKLKETDRIADFVNALKTRTTGLRELEKQQTEIALALAPIGVQNAPTNKEDCEKLNGVWDEENKTCKLPEKKEEVLQSLAILPTSGPSLSSGEMRAESFRKKLGL